MTILQIFVFDKIYRLVLRESTLVHPESAPSVHPRVHFFKVCSFVSCFVSRPLGVKGCFLVHPESAQ